VPIPGRVVIVAGWKLEIIENYSKFGSWNRGVQCRFETGALIFPVGPEFKKLPIDGYKLPLNTGSVVESIKLRIHNFFVIKNHSKSVFFLSMPW
jgi:hypothetical protein